MLTRWTDHLNAIAETLTAKQLTPLVLHGQMGTKARKAVTDQLAQPAPSDGMLLAATASLLGEGFDCPPLDTLFLAFPISFKGSVVQYVGRILRPTDTKTRVEVHDYVDILIPVLVRMHNQRRTAYTHTRLRPAATPTAIRSIRSASHASAAVAVYGAADGSMAGGEQTVAFLLDRGRLERIDAQNLAAMADTLLDRARRHGLSRARSDRCRRRLRSRLRRIPDGGRVAPSSAKGCARRVERADT